MPLPEPYRSKVRELRRAFGLLAPDRLASGAMFNVDPSDFASGGEAFFIRLCARGWKEVMDLGANEGIWTADVRRLNPDCRVTCFEPNPALAADLRARFEDQGDQVDVVEAALGSSEGIVTLNINTYSHLCSSVHRVSPETYPIDVRLTTIDQYCQNAKIEHIDCLKIDTEGNEMAVLIGAHEMITKNAVEFIQFEYGEYSWDAGTKLRDMYDILLPKYDIYHLSGDGILGVPYRVTMETFGYSNWIAVLRRTHPAG